MNIINVEHVCCSERLTSRTHPTAASMNLHRGSFLFREADTEVPPDYIVHEHYQSERFQKIKASSQQWCGIDNRTERLTSGTHGPDHRLLHRAT
jgi:hypothetical protein